MPFKGILFDIGDTLLPATALQRETLAETAFEFFENDRLIDHSLFVAAYQRLDSEPWFDSLPDLNHLYGDGRIIARTLQVIGHEPKTEIVAQFLATYRHRLRKKIKPDDQQIRGLEKLVQLNLKLGIVSNGTTEEQLDQLSLLGIRHFFHPIIVSQEAGIRKPDSRIFLMASEFWQLPPSTILMIGDRIDLDVQAAIQTGMHGALWVQFVDHRDTSDSRASLHAFARMSELVNFLKEADGHGTSFPQ